MRVESILHSLFSMTTDPADTTRRRFRVKSSKFVCFTLSCFARPDCGFDTQDVGRGSFLFRFARPEDEIWASDRVTTSVPYNRSGRKVEAQANTTRLGAGEGGQKNQSSNLWKYNGFFSLGDKRESQS